ncbi:MAG: Organic solvent tolerance protein [Polaromonas sp.]|nr:Organic solvent tolerance protein [Polaromonas sp.]
MQSASPSSFALSPVPHAVLCLAAWLSLAAASAGLAPPAYAQPAATQAPTVEAAPEAAPALKTTPLLAETPPEGPGNEVPTFLFGDRLSGRPNLETVIDGSAELRRGPTSIRADRMEYYQPDDTAKATGNVRINASGNRYQGQELQIRLDTFEGFFTQPGYQFLANGGNGQARRIDFIDDKRLIARDADYTTCERNDEASWKPAWQLTGTSFRFDQETETGTATGAVLRFKDVPIMAFPTISFPLSDKRKSGLLPPSVGLDSTSGFQFSQPYYLNIAPNRDATITPTLMTKRGVDLGGEYRYLEDDYTGQANINYMPGDKLRNRDRWSYALLHSGVIDSRVPGIGNLGLNLNLNRVSDNDYWRDFSRAGTSLTERLLASEATLSWGRGYFSAAARALKWQTLQDPLSPIVPPYDRLPQLTAAYTRVNAPIGSLGGFDWSLDGDYTRFSADKALTLQPNSDRAVTRAQLSRPFIAPGWFITPKVQLHAASYRFDAPLANGQTTASRVVPTFSLDSGLQFERAASFLGRSFTQTLEPRAFYVRTPYRDQSLLPNYDSGANDFNFATIYTENEFVGNDRISDANLLTLGVTSRLIDPDTGAEAVRFGVAQRLRFDDQRVTLPGVLPVNDRISDLLLGTSINWVPQWTFDSTVQYNPKTKRSERSTFGARYSPGNYRVVSAALRRQRDVSNLVDVAWQWPINDLWGDKGQNLGAGQGQGGGRYYGVGRLNYSIPERKLVDAVLGVEYDGCCWIGRVVLQRSQSSTASSNTRILFQLELVGFSRLGSNPLQTLRTNIPRYQSLREQGTSPSRFTTYD